MPSGRGKKSAAADRYNTRMEPLRLLPFAKLPGVEQMAADDALLSTAADAGVASLRFYAWAEPTLSLGYFQPAAARHTLPPLPWVRRATGGAALVHDRELTYALALPAGAAWQPAGQSWLCRVHHGIQEALAGLGAATEAVVCGRERKLGDVLCFEHQTAGDLVSGAAKVVGSAQRKSRGALLQHGGILLRRSEFTPGLPGLFELTGVALDPEALAARLAATFATAFAVTPGDWTPAELAARGRLAAEKYGNAAWSEKR